MKVGVALGWLARRTWASPASLLGLLVGGLSCLAGGRAQVRWGAIEFHGSALNGLLRRLPNNPVAMTLGHVIVGRTAEDLARCRAHEQVHVRQYERYGPLFIPCYLGCSLILWLRRKDPYRDNPFEVEAYGEDGRRKDEG